jgi:hypothetical protein
MEYSQPPIEPGKFRGPPYECWYCGGELKTGSVATSEGTGCLFILLGLFGVPILIGLIAGPIGAVFGGLLFGIPTFIYGLVVAARKEKYWQCRKCGAKFPRVD